MITYKTPQEINVMKEGGRISSLALKEVLKHVRVGVTTLELDQIAEKTILKHGALPSFKFVDGYAFTTCININEGIVHGLPNNYAIKRGDLISIDLGAYYGGFHTDLSYTVEVETSYEEKFLSAGKRALERAIEASVVGNKIGDIAHAIQSCIESYGYSVSRDLVGHGIGHELHEAPYVPGYGKKGKGDLF